MSDTKTAFNLRLPEDLLKQVDARADSLGISRNEWFTNMTRWVVDPKNTYTIKKKGGQP
jgi:metal-responsive CopG/Arc/MetJ family transcriptional regulator